MIQVVKNNPNPALRLVFWLACFLLLAGTAVFILEKTGVTNFYRKPIAHTQVTEITSPTNTVDYPITSSGSGNMQEDKTSGTDKPIVSDTLSGVTNYKSVVDDMLSIRVTIYQVLSSGTCTLTLIRSSDGKQVSKTAEIVQNPSSTTCAGFDIPTSELGTGSWNISVGLSGDDKTGRINDEVSI